MAARSWNSLLALGLLLAAVLVVFAAYRGKRPAPAPPAGGNDRPQPAAYLEQEGEADFSRYAVLTRSTIFRAPRGSSSAPRPPSQAPSSLPAFPLSPLVGSAGPSAGRTAPQDPLHAWRYSGHMMVDGKKVAVLENKETREARFLREGESFLEGTVSEIAARAVRLSLAGKSRVLPLETGSTPLSLAPAPPAAPSALPAREEPTGPEAEATPAPPPAGEAP